MSNTIHLCRRLENWLTHNFPKALTSFHPPAATKQIAAYERAISFKLPEDLQDWYRWHDGQKRYPKESVLFGEELLSLADSLEEWKRWQGVADMNAEIAPACTCKPEGTIVPAYSLPGWIPLAQSPAISNYLGIDLNPGPKGSKGQVIIFGRDCEDKCVLGASWADFLEFVVDELENGRVTVGQPSGSQRGDLPWTKHVLMEFFALVFRLHDLSKFDGRRLCVDETVA